MNLLRRLASADFCALPSACALAGTIAQPGAQEGRSTLAVTMLHRPGQS